MSAASLRQAFGSPLLLGDYAHWAAIRLLARPDEHLPDGVYRTFLPQEAKDAWTKDPQRFVARTHLGPPDPVGLVEFARLVREAHANGARVIELIPPMPMPLWEAQESTLKEFYSRIRADFDQNDPLIDCNGPAFEAFRRDLASFTDAAHLSTERVGDFLELLNREFSRIPPAEPLAAGRR